MSQHLGRTSLAYSRQWHLVNVGGEERSLGRLATSIAITLMGKHKPIFHPSNDCGDYVVATGCHDLHVTGKKREQKMYYKHTTRPGKGFQQINMERVFKKFGGGEVLRRAVSGMLPKNRLRDVRLDRLKVFEGPSHPYTKNITNLEPLTVRRGPTKKPTHAAIMKGTTTTIGGKTSLEETTTENKNTADAKAPKVVGELPVAAMMSKAAPTTSI